MCVSSNLRCGSCLAKWNGKTWEPVYRCVLPLKSWTLVLNKEYQLCVEGQCDVNFNLTVCVPITDCLNRFWIISDDALVKIRGVFNTRNLPEYVAGRFSDGVPSDWKEIGSKWVQYIQQGEKVAFNWRGDDSFASSDTSILLARVSRNVSSGKNGKAKEKSTQETLENRVRESDSAISSSDPAKQQENSPSEVFSCPWLPAHKVQAISQWIDRSQIPAPLSDLEINTGNRGSSLDSLFPSDSASVGHQINQKRREQFSDRTARNPTEAIPQSTPINNERNSRSAGQALSFDLSSIVNVSGDSHRVLTDSPESDLVDGVFRKPKIAVPGGKPKINVRNEGSESKVSKSQSSLQSKSKNSEVTGKGISQTFSVRLRNRPRRKQTSQKIERWRPVLGVDGYLKVQGYLLLSGDMTAGQVLTTNTVVQWGYRKVETCDGREYELVGDPYEKIPEDLRNSLLKPISCEEITKKLRAYQSLRDDVASCPYLAPPPTPMTINVTRSGRMCRPRTPYWLNRSDWGAEYELFYGNDSAYGTNNSRLSSNTARRGTSASQSIPSSSQDCDAEAPSPACKVTQASDKATTRLSGDAQECSSSSETMSPSGTSPIRKSSRIIERQLQGKYFGWKNKKRRRIRTILNSSSESEDVNDSESIEKDRNVRNRADEIRTSFENINSKVSQNQMMLPSLRLASESSIVHFSPSRIKVSYLSNSPNTGQKAVQTVPESSSEGLMQDGSTDTEDLLAFKQSQFSNGPIVPPLRQFAHRSPEILRKPVRVASQSPVSRVTGRQSLQSLNRRNLSAPVGLTNNTSTNPVTKIFPKVPASKSPNNRIAVATKTPAMKTMSKSPAVTTATQTPIRRTTKSPVVRTTKKSLSRKTAAKSPVTTASDAEIPASKTQKSSSVSTNNAATTTSNTEIPISKTRKSSSGTTKSPAITISNTEIPTSKTRKGSSVTTRSPAITISDTEIPISKTRKGSSATTKSPAITISNAEIPASKTQKDSSEKESSVKRHNRKTPSKLTSSGKTPSSKQPQHSARNSVSGRTTAKALSSKMIAAKVKEPWVVVKRLDSESDTSVAKKTNKELSQKTQQINTTEKVKPVTKKIGSPKSATKSGRGKLKKQSKIDTKKKTPRIKTTKEKKKTTEKVSSFQSSEESENADDNASECSNISDMSVGPSASVIFAMDSPTSRRAPRTLKERRERDEKLAQMGKRLAAREAVDDDDDDPMAGVFKNYNFSSFPEEWCKHENILRQNRKRRRPSSSDGTTSPHSVFDDGFGNEDATSSVATPQLLMKPPDPKQVQSYLQRQRALNSRPQRSTRPVHKNTKFTIPDIDYGAVFSPNLSDSEASSMVSDFD